METKKCLYCKKDLTIDNFSKCKKSKDGLKSRCKNCLKDQEKKRLKNNTEYNKNIDPYLDINKTKICINCKLKQNITNFSILKSSKDGLRSICNKCMFIKNKEYRNKNIDKNKNINHYENPLKTKICNYCKLEKSIVNFCISKRNPDGLNNKCKECKNKIDRINESKPLCRKNKNEYLKNRLRNNIKYRLSNNISGYIRNSLIRGKEGRHWEELVGYTVEELKIHLEKQFKEGMNWENYGLKGWHIDHIKPISSFNINSVEDEDFKKCWALNNLQPLWALENIRKSDKISEIYGNL